VWLGYQQSLRPCQTGLTLNIDISATAFLEEQEMMNFMAAALGGRGIDLTRLNPMQVKKINRAIRGVQVGCWGSMSLGYRVVGMGQEYMP